MRESRNLEFKEQITNTFLKTVSAFANYGDGVICFGVNDDGTEVGVENPTQVCMEIENKINDSIDPVPNYYLEIVEKFSVVKLYVFEGLDKPYFYKSKAYRRNDTATVEVGRTELRRLILEGQNSSYEEMKSKRQNLTFDVLGKKIGERLGINSLTLDNLKTLELSDAHGDINNAGALLADENDFPGIDMTRFGSTIDVILDRVTFEQKSILSLYDHSIAVYRQYYQYERIDGAERTTHERIPEKAFREAIANALIHRRWDVNANISVSMFEDRMEIVSPGGLLDEISEESYMRGGLSVMRNRIIGSIFLRLKLIERLGTGIRRINEAYLYNYRKPMFEVSESSIKVVLPVFSGIVDLSADENKVYDLVKGRRVASSEIKEATGFGKSKVVSTLNKLVDEGYIRTSGTGRGIRYYVEKEYTK